MVSVALDRMATWAMHAVFTYDGFSGLGGQGMKIILCSNNVLKNLN